MEEYTIKVTPEEFAEINSIIRKKREEQAKQAAIAAHDLLIREVVTRAVDAIGLEETKHIIHAIGFDLRRSGTNNI